MEGGGIKSWLDFRCMQNISDKANADGTQTTFISLHPIRRHKGRKREEPALFGPTRYLKRKHIDCSLCCIWHFIIINVIDRKSVV